MDNRETEAGMRILAIETSTAQASLSLYLNGEIRVNREWKAERNHDAHLFPALQAAMDALGGDAPEYILVGSGPGSYGGVRVALAAATGIAQVTGAAVVALCSWIQLEKDGAVVVSDAKRGGWTLRRPDGSISVVSTTDVLELAQQGVAIHTTEVPGTLAARGIPADEEGLFPTAKGLIYSWLRMTPQQQSAAAAAPIEPIYVRPPHITKAVRKPWEIH